LELAAVTRRERIKVANEAQIAPAADYDQPVVAAAQGVTPNSDYAELRRRIAALGLFGRQPGFYAGAIGVALALTGLGVAGLAFSSSLWTQALAAAVLALATGRLALLLHDGAHRQIWPPGRRSDVFCLIVGPLLVGISASWWKQKHDRHHAHPNDEHLDPDLQIAALAFTDDQARRTPRLLRPIARNQAYLLPLLVLFEGIQLRVAGVKYLLTHRCRYRRTELALIGIHVAGYAALVVATVGVTGALVVIGVHQALFGLYAGSLFAPNHKGMPIVDAARPWSFLEQQVITARNVRAHRWIEWWYGGLNYQIEHHLFPTLPRNRLRDACPAVRSFCADRGIPYHETSAWRSYRDLLRSMHAAARPLRSGT
jgi:fatty acid desaturase